jgi:hypothetical protein
MLDKFQEQNLMGSVEHLEDSLELIYNKKEDDDNRDYAKAILHIKVAIDKIKNINPTLFNYPREAKYISGKYESTLDWDGEE